MNISLSQAIEGYELAAHARRLSKRTLADYGNTFAKLQAFLKDDPPLSAVTAEELRRFLSAQTGVTRKTLLNYHTVLSALWRWAADQRVVKSNIVRTIARPRPEATAIEPYSEADIRAMLVAVGRSLSYKRPLDSRCVSHAVDDLIAARNWAVILLLLDTGMRASELSGLRIGDVDLRNRKVKVMGKGAKERIVPFSPRTGQALWRYLAQRSGESKGPNRPLPLAERNSMVRTAPSRPSDHTSAARTPWRDSVRRPPPAHRRRS